MSSCHARVGCPRLKVEQALFQHGQCCWRRVCLRADGARRRPRPPLSKTCLPAHCALPAFAYARCLHARSLSPPSPPPLALLQLHKRLAMTGCRGNAAPCRRLTNLRRQQPSAALALERLHSHCPPLLCFRLAVCCPLALVCFSPPGTANAGGSPLHPSVLLACPSSVRHILWILPHL